MTFGAESLSEWSLDTDRHDLWKTRGINNPDPVPRADARECKDNRSGKNHIVLNDNVRSDAKAYIDTIPHAKK